MNIKRSVKESAHSIPKTIGLSLLVSMITTLLGIAGCSYLIHKEMIRQEGMGIIVTIVLIISSAAGAFTAITYMKRMVLQMSLLSGLSYLLLLMSTTALFFNGQYGGVLGVAFTILAGCSFVAILKILPNRRGKSFKRKTAYR